MHRVELSVRRDSRAGQDRVARLGGMRAGEIERLRWETVMDRLVRVPGTKTDKSRRTIPIAPALMHRLSQVHESARRGSVVEHWGNVRRDLRAAVRRANSAASGAAVVQPPEPIPFVSPNDLRRTFASWLAQNNVPLLVIASLLGHSSTRMVEKVYGKLSAKNMDDAIAVLPAFGARRESDNRSRLSTTSEHEPECAIHAPGGECSCPRGQP